MEVIMLDLSSIQWDLKWNKKSRMQHQKSEQMLVKINTVELYSLAGFILDEPIKTTQLLKFEMVGNRVMDGVVKSMDLA